MENFIKPTENETQKATRPTSINNLPKKPRRSNDAIDAAIMTVLKLSDRSLCASDVAKAISSNFFVAKRHLRKLSFEGKLESLSFGDSGRWIYYKVK